MTRRRAACRWWRRLHDAVIWDGQPLRVTYQAACHHSACPPDLCFLDLQPPADWEALAGAVMPKDGA